MVADPTPETIHDRLARLEAGVAAPVRSVWRHVWHTAGISALVVILVLLAWLVSSVVNRYNRGKELLQAAQPVVVAQSVTHQLSEPELVAKYHLSTAPGAVRLAPKPGTKKKRQPVEAHGTPRAGASGQAGSASPSDQPEQAQTTILVPEKKVPRLPYGGTAIGSLVGKPSEEPSFELEFKPDPRPRFQLGGLSRAGGEWDFVGKRAGLFLERDFLSIHLGSNDSCAAKSWRCGRALVLGARPYLSYSYQAAPGAKASDYGVPITLAIDW
jgi:hypothetical protein